MTPIFGKRLKENERREKKSLIYTLRTKLETRSFKHFLQSVSDNETTHTVCKIVLAIGLHLCTWNSIGLYWWADLESVTTPNLFNFPYAKCKRKRLWSFYFLSFFPFFVIKSFTFFKVWVSHARSIKPMSILADLWKKKINLIPVWTQVFVDECDRKSYNFYSTFQYLFCKYSRVKRCTAE